MNTTTAPISLEKALAEADEIVQSDHISKATAKAVLEAARLAGDELDTVDHCREASRKHRAKLRNEAAAFGYLRDAYSGEWHHVAHELDEHEDIYTLEVEDDEVLATLAVYVVLGGVIAASVILPESFTERQQKRLPA
jgi:hypothetical protein